jgi:hypothetical protein
MGLLETLSDRDYRNPDRSAPATSRCARHKGKECTRVLGQMTLLELPRTSQACQESD